MRPSHELLHEEVNVSVPEAAHILGVSRQLGYRLAAEGKIPSIRVGHRIVIPTEALRMMMRDATQWSPDDLGKRRHD